MDGCIFCSIAMGDAPASVVHRDEHCVAFLDLQPIHPGHLLVVPTRHATHLADLAPPDGQHLFAVAQRLAAGLRVTDGIQCEGVNLLLSDGAVAGQEVFHVHLHVLPRFEDDGFRFRVSRQVVASDRDALDATALRIRDALAL